MSLGRSLDHATQLRDAIDNHGCVLEELGCNEELIAMLKSLHTNSWFKFSDLDSVIISKKGGDNDADSVSCF